MKFVEIPPIKKAVGIALVAGLAYVILEGTGIGAPARQAVGAATTQVKAFFMKLFGKTTVSSS
jgi:hypothetical protein